MYENARALVDSFTIRTGILQRRDAQLTLAAKELFEVPPLAWKGNRNLVSRFGRYLSREMHYDFPIAMPTGADDRAFVWVGNEYDMDAIGACAFQFIAGAPTLTWVWFHPFERNQGHLTRAWRYFRGRYAGFEIEHPLSEAMAGFLRRHDAPSP